MSLLGQSRAFPAITLSPCSSLPGYSQSHPLPCLHPSACLGVCLHASVPLRDVPILTCEHRGASRSGSRVGQSTPRLLQGHFGASASWRRALSMGSPRASLLVSLRGDREGTIRRRTEGKKRTRGTQRRVDPRPLRRGWIPVKKRRFRVANPGRHPPESGSTTTLSPRFWLWVWRKRPREGSIAPKTKAGGYRGEPGVGEGAETA